MKNIFRRKPFKGGAREIGTHFEEYTRARLEEQGFGFMAHSYKSHPYEIDLIMTDGSDIVFVEVKARRDSDPIKPELQVNEGKMAYILFAAAHFVADMQEMEIDTEAFGYRFDVAAIKYGDKDTVTDFRYYKNYYDVPEEDLLQLAYRYRVCAKENK